jgi:hypothetical protein
MPGTLTGVTMRLPFSEVKDLPSQRKALIRVIILLSLL